MASKPQYENYFKFTVIRNPWDRAYSWYRNVVRDPLHRRAFRVSEDCTFEAFMHDHLGCWALDPQMDWLTDRDGTVRVDYVGRFETLNDSYNEARAQIGLEPIVLNKLLHSDQKDYRHAYTDELRERVAEKYAEEITLFAYSFDD